MQASRRAFLAAASAAVLTSRKSHAQTAESRNVTINAASPIGTVRPELHGHFAEHLGSCIYGGLWVGKNSPIPNINGHRRQAVEWLKAVGIPVLRWPGGCFADDYHWRDGIGPAEKRPRRVNIHWGKYTEDNSYGTHEFLELCQLIGAQPYLAGNLGSGTPQEMRDWMEYCNYPSGSTLADERIANGAKAPFNVKFWGVGNENWGCGGNMSGDEYATEYRRFATYIRNGFDVVPPGTPRGQGPARPYLIACGPNGNSAEWTNAFFKNMGRRANMVDAFAMHYYSTGRAPATKFTKEDYAEQIRISDLVEKAVLDQYALLRTYDPNNRIHLLLDEWGVWDRIQPEDVRKYGALFQQITQRSAVAAALGLNMFNRQADKLAMTNIAQIVNVLHALILTEGPKAVRTSTYYVYEMMAAHRGQQALATENADTTPMHLSISASSKDKTLISTLVNPKLDTPLDVNIALAGATPKAAAARLLFHSDFNAYNTFDGPEAIAPKAHKVEVAASGLKISLPPCSIATLNVTLA